MHKHNKDNISGPFSLKLGPPADVAAGPKGVQVALQHAIKAMGPVKAMQSLAKMNQEKGFDCPGCAWPDPDDKRSLFAEYCENGAKALAEEATRKRVTPDFFGNHSISDLYTWTDYELGKSGRLTHPMIKLRNSDFYEKISWSEAIKVIAHHLNDLPSPDAATFYTSGRSSNEAAYLYGLFIRAFGTNNMPDCSNMCHESSGVALKETVGIGKGSVTLDDLHKAEVVIVIGQNPGTNHPRMLSALQALKQNGGKVITINPLEEAGLKRFKNPQKPIDYFTTGTRITDLYLPVKINQDIPLLKAIIKRLHQEDQATEGSVWDHQFIEEKVAGYRSLVDDLDKHDIDNLLEHCGISKKDLESAVKFLVPAKKIIICWAMGLTQHENGVDNIKECVNLLLLKGSIGKEGAGTCPVRGHSNVQGDRSVGIMHTVSPALNNAIQNYYNFVPPNNPGLDTIGSIKGMYEGKVKVFIALGGNFASAASDTEYTESALRKCKLTVQISTKLNRSHLVTGDTAIILPTLGRSEKDISHHGPRFVTVENSMGKVHSSQGHLSPASKHLKSEPEIIAMIADATLKSKVDIKWLELGSDYSRIRSDIATVIKGFSPLVDNSQKGFYLPNNARQGDFDLLPGGKAKLSICKLPAHNLNKDEFMLMTIRSHDQFNTTIYGLHDRYRGVYNERRVIFMNADDMKEKGLIAKQLVDVESCYNAKVRIAKSFYLVPYQIPRKNLAGYFPELNPIVPIDAFAKGSRTPISKSIIVKIRPYNEPS